MQDQPSSAPEQQAYNGFTASEAGGHLQIQLHNRFDHETQGKPWAGIILEAYPQPLQEVVVDFSHCPTVSSTVFAGLIQLQQGFAERCPQPLRLVQVSDQVRRSLQMLRIAELFRIEPS